jgi:hypothetical protein
MKPKRHQEGSACQSRFDNLPQPAPALRPLAPLLFSLLLLPACATKKDSPTPPPDSPDPLAAVFVDEPARKPFPNPFASLSNLLPKKKSPPAPVASPVDWAGEIRMVNVAENFVLVESHSAASAVPGEKYTAIRDGRETGVVRMTPLRNPPFLIADIVSGSPNPGDKIHLPRPTVPLPAPDSTKPSASPKPAPPPAEADSAKPPAPNPLARLAASLREILPTRRPKP